MGKREPESGNDSQPATKKAKPVTNNAATAKKSPSCGILFDLDGVVYRKGKCGYELVPGARESLMKLQKLNVPHIFVTNGTGVTEAEKAETVRKLVGLDYITTQHMVLATTPLHSLPNKDAQILVVAHTSEQAYKLGKHYGWSKMVSVQDFGAKNGILTPGIKRDPVTTRDTVHEPIEAVVVVSEPSNWYEAIQIVCDVVRSGGTVEEDTKEQTVPVYSGNPDVEYATTHSVPRFTNGGFLLCVQTLFEASTKRQLTIQYQGKPYIPIYEEAKLRLGKLVNGEASCENGNNSQPNINDMTDGKLQTIYAIGDNPKSDIRGANAASFHSILVRTGVFQGKANSEEFPAKYVCNDIQQAVDYILKRET